MVPRAFFVLFCFHCLSRVATQGQGGQVCCWPRGTGGEAECPPGVPGNPGWCPPPAQASGSGSISPSALARPALAALDLREPVPTTVPPVTQEASPSTASLLPGRGGTWALPAQEPGPVLAAVVLSCDFGEDRLAWGPRFSPLCRGDGEPWGRGAAGCACTALSLRSGAERCPGRRLQPLAAPQAPLADGVSD